MTREISQVECPLRNRRAGRAKKASKGELLRVRFKVRGCASTRQSGRIAPGNMQTCLDAQRQQEVIAQRAVELPARNAVVATAATARTPTRPTLRRVAAGEV